MHVCDDVPVPAVHGGRVAMRNEVCATREAGHEVFVLAFHRGELTPAELAANRGLADGFAAVRRASIVAASLRHPFAPYQVSSRLEGGSALGQAIAWRPDLVVCHHEWTLPAALRITRSIGGAPVVLRAHNDELRYYRDLRRNGRGLRLAYYTAEHARVRSFLAGASEFGIAEIWYMSAADVSENWRHIPHRVIPPIMFAGPAEDRSEVLAPQTKTVLFVGSLDVPHAVAGLEWYLSLAWPRIRAEVPEARFVVAGRRPSPRLIQAVGDAPGAVLVADPETLDGVFADARIFVNPVFAGSGVNLKLGEPMRRAVPVVTTTVGVRGLDHSHGGLGVSDTPEGFAEACVDLLNADDMWLKARSGLLATRAPYSAAAVGKAIAAAILGHARGQVTT